LSDFTRGLESDVDLAVDGLVGGVDYWEAWKAVEEMVEDRLVDLIDIDMASKSLIQANDVEWNCEHTLSTAN